MGSSFLLKGDKIFVSSDESGIYSLYEVDIKSVKKNCLIDFEDSIYVVVYFFKDECVLFIKDLGGNECYYIYVCEIDGIVKDFIFGEEICVGFVGFIEDGKYFFIISN